jgi:hypothetical protein
MSNSRIFPARWPGDGESLPFADDTEFFASLTRDQRKYLLQHWRERQADLQMAMRDVAIGLSTINELNDAAVRAVDRLASLGGRHENQLSLQESP